MTSKEDFEKLINNLRSKLDDTTNAMVSDELISTMSAYNSGYDEYEKMRDEKEKMKQEKEELLKVNGKLYQRIGFEDKEEKIKEEKNKNDNIEELKIEDIINEKGDLI